MRTDEDHEYFVARGAALQAVRDWQAEVATYREACFTLAAELGGTPAFWGNQRLAGFYFDGQEPSPDTGLRRDRKHTSIWVPYHKTSAGKALAKRIKEGLQPEPPDFTPMLFPKTFAGGIEVRSDGPFGFAIGYCGFESIGDDIVISVPIARGKDHADCPPGAEPLARSEYWRRKEAAVPPAASLPPETQS